MKSFLRGVMGSAASAGPSGSTAMRVTEAPKALHYSLSTFRWHMTSLPPSKAIAVHDYLGSCAAWDQVLNESLGELPLSRLTPREPLEVYSVDLRGHNFSEAIAVGEGESLVSASAADIALLQQDILKTEAKLTGIGFGAMVACHAALHAPDSFSALVLFVRDLSQLFECDPAAYGVRPILQAASHDAKSIRELNEYLKQAVPNSVERAVLLSSIEEKAGAARFRLSSELLKREEKLVMSPNAAGAQFDKPVKVLVVNSKASPPSEAELARFRQLFPKGDVVQMNLASDALTSGTAPIVPIMLQYFDLLGEVAGEEEQGTV